MLTKEEYQKRRQELIDKQDAVKKARRKRESEKKKMKLAERTLFTSRHSKYVKCFFSPLGDCEGQLEEHHIHMNELEDYYKRDLPRKYKQKPKGKLGEKLILCTAHHRRLHTIFRQIGKNNPLFVYPLFKSR